MEKKLDSEPDHKLNRGAMTPRIIQYKGHRSCIRLETVYWDILVDEANSKDCKLNELVHGYYTNPDAELNKTAYLRRRAVEWLNHKVHRANKKLHLRSSELYSVMRATIQPSIVFSEMQSVSRYNKAFRVWLGEHTLCLKKKTDYEKLRVSFRRSFECLSQRLDEGKGSVKAEQVTILLPGFVLPVKMNLVKIHKLPNEEQLFLGIISDAE